MGPWLVSPCGDGGYKEGAGLMGADTRGLGKYSLGIGDRFAREAEAQLGAFFEAARLGVDVTPVWNKSHREHVVVGSDPTSVRGAADAAVRAVAFQPPSRCSRILRFVELLSTIRMFLPVTDSI